MQPELAKQYLKAMGITAWVPRSTPQANTTVSEVPAVAVTQALAPLARVTPVASYINALGDSSVVVSQAGSGELLLVLEPPVLEQAGRELLAAMLKAIDFDIALQGIVQFAADGEQSLSAVVATQPVSTIIVMAAHGGDMSALQEHRSTLHSAAWFAGTIAVTIHPQELIVDPANKRPAWEDLKRVKAGLVG